MVYVDETDEKARKKALTRRARPIAAFCPRPRIADELAAFQKEHAQSFIERRESGAADIALHLLDGEWLLEHDLVLIGSPDTVAKKLEKIASEGVFNTFFGEFNFSDLAEEDLMRSIRLFGTEVMPRLRNFEPF